MKHCLAVEYSFYTVKMVQLYMWLALTFAKSCLLCLMLLHTYYAKNYAGIIDSGLFLRNRLAVQQLLILLNKVT